MSDDSIKLLDLTEDGDTKLRTVSDEDLKSVEIISMNWMNVNFFEEKNTPTFKKNRASWEVEIEVNIFHLYATYFVPIFSSFTTTLIDQ